MLWFTIFMQVCSHSDYLACLSLHPWELVWHRLNMSQVTEFEMRWGILQFECADYVRRFHKVGLAFLQKGHKYRHLWRHFAKQHLGWVIRSGLESHMHDIPHSCKSWNIFSRDLYCSFWEHVASPGLGRSSKTDAKLAAEQHNYSIWIHDLGHAEEDEKVLSALMLEEVGAFN